MWAYALFGWRPCRLRVIVCDMCARCACFVSDQRERPKCGRTPYLAGGPAALGAKETK